MTTSTAFKAFFNISLHLQPNHTTKKNPKSDTLLELIIINHKLFTFLYTLHSKWTKYSSYARKTKKSNLRFAKMLKRAKERETETSLDHPIRRRRSTGAMSKDHHRRWRRRIVAFFRFILSSSLWRRWWRRIHLFLQSKTKHHKMNEALESIYIISFFYYYWNEQ